MKTCRVCGETKQEELFPKNKNSCKKCESRRQVQYQKEHREQKNEYEREKYKKYKARINERQGKYRDNNREKISSHYKETSAHVIAVAWFRKNTGLSAIDIPKDWIWVKELQLKVQRKIKERRQVV